MSTIEHSIHGDMENEVAVVTARSRPSRQRMPHSDRLVGAYVIVSMFMLIYFSRPEDWIPGLSNVPLEKFTGVLALLALVFSVRYIRLRVPLEVTVLFLFVVQLFVASGMSSVWQGGALQQTVNFAKVLVIVIAMIVTVNTIRRLRHLISIQAASVAVIAAVAVWKGNLIGGRLEGILGGNYQDPNDLALVITISLPLCLALLFISTNVLWKAAWGLAVLVMVYAIFLTGSRGGFLSLVVVACASLWVFAIRGRRRYLLLLAILGVVILWQSSNGVVFARLKGTFGFEDSITLTDMSSQGRMQLLLRSIEVTEEHPLFGVGPGNFQMISGKWQTAHNSFTLISSEAGIPALVLYVLFLWCGFKNLRTVNRLAQGETELSLLAKALQVSVIGYAVGSFFLSMTYEFFPYILVGYTTLLVFAAKKGAPRPRIAAVPAHRN